MLSRSEFQELFNGDWTSAWRWECQGVYHEPHEQEPLRRFLAGEPDDLSWYRWPSRVRAWVAAGRSVGRVRMLTDPHTDYLRFEQQVLTPPAVDAGEDIRYVSQRWAVGAGAPTDDYWLFDDATVVVMTFDEHGVSGADLITDPVAVRGYVAWRDAVTREAAPYARR